MTGISAVFRYTNGMANVMLVEDNDIYRELLRELCEMENHFVLDTSSAEEMISLVKSKTIKVRVPAGLDLIICDFNMGAMNGYELISTLRQ